MHLRSALFLFATTALIGAEPLTLDDAIRVAWANDPAISVLSLSPELASARELHAATPPNPEIELRAGTLLRGDSEWSAGIGWSRPLPRRERIELARALARLGGEPAAIQIRAQRRQVAGEVRLVFYQLAVQQARLDATRRTHEAQSALLASLEQLHAAGEIGESEREYVRLEAARAAQGIALAEAELSVLHQRLLRRLRVTGDRIEPVIELAALLQRPLPEPAANLADQPAVALAGWGVRQAEAALALSRSESKADWKVGAGLDFERRSNDATGRLENEPALSVSASIPWPGRIANRGDIREKEAALRIAEAAEFAAGSETSADIAAAVATARALQPVVARHRQTLAAAEELPRRLLAAYERGELPALQLAQARQQRLSLELDYLETVSRYLQALAEAETATGLMPATP